jgi:hypothetical protein
VIQILQPTLGGGERVRTLGKQRARGVEGERVEGLFVQEQIDPREPSDAQLLVADAVLAFLVLPAPGGAGLLSPDACAALPSTGAAGECVRMAAKAGLFMDAMRGQ